MFLPCCDFQPNELQKDADLNFDNAFDLRKATTTFRNESDIKTEWDTFSVNLLISDR